MFEQTVNIALPVASSGLSMSWPPRSGRERSHRAGWLASRIRARRPPAGSSEGRFLSASGIRSICILCICISDPIRSDPIYIYIYMYIHIYVYTHIYYVYVCIICVYSHQANETRKHANLEWQLARAHRTQFV